MGALQEPEAESGQDYRAARYRMRFSLYNLPSARAIMLLITRRKDAAFRGRRRRYTEAP
jgi:hypothetical protein